MKWIYLIKSLMREWGDLIIYFHYVKKSIIFSIKNYIERNKSLENRIYKNKENIKNNQNKEKEKKESK